MIILYLGNAVLFCKRVHNTQIQVRSKGTNTSSMSVPYLHTPGTQHRVTVRVYSAYTQMYWCAQHTPGTQHTVTIRMYPTYAQMIPSAPYLHWYTLHTAGNQYTPGTQRTVPVLVYPTHSWYQNRENSSPLIFTALGIAVANVILHPGRLILHYFAPREINTALFCALVDILHFFTAREIYTAV